MLESTRPDCACDRCCPDTPLPHAQSREALSGPARFVACPERGTHRAVTDCWICWSDVHQGHYRPDEVLAPDAWDLVAFGLPENAASTAPQSSQSSPAPQTPTLRVVRHS